MLFVDYQRAFDSLGRAWIWDTEDRFLENSEYACSFTYILVEASAICMDDGPK